ncbi:MAG: DUF962 domain-containing protein [Chitinophagales bacterium]|nr:DUF962 domain-containing protein [Chitinophagales bacterium]MCZ2394668.1 DUF962 domain-containing protein [Chitinophagales bacterium]
MSINRFQSLKEFYPYYLTEHSNLTCRRLHYIGTSLFIATLISAILSPVWWKFVLMPVIGYGFAWVGHFVFEKNKPATFQYPLWSLMSDFIMLFHFITGQVNKKLEEAHQKIA